MEAVNKGMEMDFERGAVSEAVLFGVACRRKIRRKGLRAFLEKRAAQFKGK